MENMWWWIGALLWVFSIVILWAIAYRLGEREGTRLEKLRCGNILQRSLNIRFSPTTKAALECINGITTLDEMEEELLKLTEIMKKYKFEGESNVRKKRNK